MDIDQLATLMALSAMMRRAEEEEEGGSESDNNDTRESFLRETLREMMEDSPSERGSGITSLMTETGGKYFFELPGVTSGGDIKLKLKLPDEDRVRFWDIEVKADTKEAEYSKPYRFRYGVNVNPALDPASATAHFAHGMLVVLFNDHTAESIEALIQSDRRPFAPEIDG